jgi:transcription elongation factor GreA
VDFAQAKTDQVNIGTRVRLTDLDNNQAETYSILGAWDSNPDRHIVSYMTPFAQSLLGKKVGEEATLEMEGHNRRFRIEGIEPYVATAEESADANKPKVQLETDHGTGNTA